jgi:hypothetical protein
MNSISQQEAVDLSREYVENPSSHCPLTVTPNGKRITDCIEPRDPLNILYGKYDVVIQTPGGGPGASGDAAIARGIDSQSSSNLILWRVEDGVADNNMRLEHSLYRAHLRCAFLGALATVYDEMADPSDFTQETFERWSSHFLLKDMAVRRRDVVSYAAASGRDYILRLGMDVRAQSLLDKTAKIGPAGSVHEVEGENVAKVYVASFMPNLGQDRNKKPQSPEVRQKVQSYYDSIAAYIADLGTARGMMGPEKDWRFVASLLRSAATMSVISQGQRSDMHFYELLPSSKKEHGFEVIEYNFTD